MNITGEANIVSNKNPTVIAEHRKVAHSVAILTVILVLLIEIGVRIKGGSELNKTFWIHVCFSALYGLSLLGLFFLPHGQNNKIHEYLARLCMFSFFVSACIGIPMLFFRFK